MNTSNASLLSHPPPHLACPSPDAIQMYDGMHPNKALRPSLTITFAARGAGLADVQGLELSVSAGLTNDSTPTSPTSDTAGSSTRSSVAVIVMCAVAGVLGAGLVVALLVAARLKMKSAQGRRPVVARARSWHAVAAASSPAAEHHVGAAAGSSRPLSSALKAASAPLAWPLSSAGSSGARAGESTSSGGGAGRSQLEVAVANQVSVGNPACSPRGDPGRS